MYYFEQSAGNLHPTLTKFVRSGQGSSETTRNPQNNFILRRYSPLNRNFIRFYSLKTDNTKNLNPLISYNCLKEDRFTILKNHKNKSGVYCLINNINGHSYVGSTININSRIKNYLNNNNLKNSKNINMPIVKAILKYGQLNFSLLILEYVNVKNLASRETFFISSIVPYYNVLKQGYSSLGYIHTEETIKLLSQLAKNRTHSNLTKSLISKALTGENNPFYNKTHSTESKVRMIEANSLYSVYVYNSKKDLLVIFPSVLTLAKKINSNHSTVVKYIKNLNLFRGEWYFTNIPFNIDDNPIIDKWSDKECDNLILNINKSNYIKKAIFVYDLNKNFLFKFDGVTKAQKALKINHSIIKKYAKVKGNYNKYIFSYERIN